MAEEIGRRQRRRLALQERERKAALEKAKAEVADSRTVVERLEEKATASASVKQEKDASVEESAVVVDAEDNEASDLDGAVDEVSSEKEAPVRRLPLDGAFDTESNDDGAADVQMSVGGSATGKDFVAKSETVELPPKRAKPKRQAKDKPRRNVVDEDNPEFKRVRGVSVDIVEAVQELFPRTTPQGLALSAFCAAHLEDPDLRVPPEVAEQVELIGGRNAVVDIAVELGNIHRLLLEMDKRIYACELASLFMVYDYSGLRKATANGPGGVQFLEGDFWTLFESFKEQAERFRREILIKQGRPKPGAGEKKDPS